MDPNEDAVYGSRLHPFIKTLDIEGFKRMSDTIHDELALPRHSWPDDRRVLGSLHSMRLHWVDRFTAEEVETSRAWMARPENHDCMAAHIYATLVSKMDDAVREVLAWTENDNDERDDDDAPLMAAMIQLDMNDIASTVQKIVPDPRLN